MILQEEHRQQIEEQSYSLLFDAGKTKFGILCLVLFLLVQGEDGEIGEDLAEDYEASQGSRACT